jgi:1-acyl-sn-glycerol-3-phosphate acyltransferase
VISRLVRLALGRMQVSGLEHLPAKGPFLICPNHQSYIDPICMCAVVPYRTFANQFYVGAVEYFGSTVTRWIARAINLVPVDPDSNLVPAMQAGAFGLRHGKILMLFPEGERSMMERSSDSRGRMILARHLSMPIVPVALHGIYEIWPRNRAINWGLLPWAPSRNDRVWRADVGEDKLMPRPLDCATGGRMWKRSNPTGPPRRESSRGWSHAPTRFTVSAAPLL